MSETLGGRNALKERAGAVYRNAEPRILAFARALHDEPELGFHENKASRMLTDELLRIDGAQVVRGLGTLPTAVRADVGRGKLVLTLCAEYDALPEIGHGCGHNIIAGATLGAFTALSGVVDELDVTLRLLGTPAEEQSLGGKVVMLGQGDFAGTHAALMVHPYAEDLVGFRSYACASYEIIYHGRSAHASAAPHEGVNALDALTVAMVSIGLARQHLEPGQQLHGHVTHGGDSASVIPDRAVARYMVRAPDKESLERVTAVLMRCLEAGAVATGGRLAVRMEGHPYAELDNDDAIEERFAANLRALGRNPRRAQGISASTDMGNVSHAFPTIHPMIGLGPDTPTIHSAEFAAHSITPSGEAAIRDGALALAWTCIDLALDSAERQRLLRIQT
ncbi:M20 family metallopeptidase [Agromyces sp. NPDC056379]|uniref:M20 family metallopeptidase n=1 Tax=unclassified Agromyces TaxID=2639701 RepID=UPI0035E2F4E0